MKKYIAPTLSLLLALSSCNPKYNRNKEQSQPRVNSSPIQTDKIETTTKKNEDLSDSKNEQVSVSFINDSLFGDTLLYKEEYLVQIQINGIPDSLVAVAVSNGKIVKAENTGEYIFHNRRKGLVSISIGYWDLLKPNSYRPKDVSRKEFYIK